MSLRKNKFGELIVILGLILLTGCNSMQDGAILELDREPIIDPDYSGVTIPQNIAPLNFIIDEEGISYKVIAVSSNGTHMTFKSSDGIINFPHRSWDKLQKNNHGGEISLEVSVVSKEKKLKKFNPLHLHIANEPIDPYLCYRLLYPGYEKWSEISIKQRSVEDFKEESLVENQVIENNCVNCHSFNQNNPEKFLLHIRGSMGGTYFVEGKEIRRTNLKTEDMTAGAVYPAWHPEGRFVAFSSNQVTQSFHAIYEKNIEVLDLASSLILYDTWENEILPAREKDTIAYMETFPEWSPDGKSLYYCRTKQFIKGSDFTNIKYDLVRKAFNPSSRSFGKPEIVFNALSINKSVSFPRISPDGKYLVFTLHDYGTFSIWHKEADLFLLDLRNGEVTRMSLNSPEVESYHSWSSNSKWLVFSSKRGDGLTARPYFAYIGSADEIGKPFVLPQKDPTLYKGMLKTFNKPEFVTGKIDLGPRDFRNAAREKATEVTGSSK